MSTKNFGKDNPRFGKMRLLTPSDVADWICSTLERTCSKNHTYPFLRPVYRTICFFHEALCKMEEVNATAVAPPAKKDPNYSLHIVQKPACDFISLGFYEFVTLVVFVTSIMLALSYVVMTKKHHKIEVKKVGIVECVKTTRAKYGSHHVVKPDNHWINRDEILQTNDILHLPDNTVTELIQKQSHLEEYIESLVTKCKEFKSEIATLQQKYLEMETKYKCDIQGHQTRYEGVLQKLSSAESQLEQICALRQKEVASLGQQLDSLHVEKVRLEDQLKPEKLESSGEGFSANVSDKSVLTVDAHVQDSLEKIEEKWQEIEELKRQVGAFRDSKRSKSFLHLEELVIRNMTKLDNVESHGNWMVRQRRRALMDILNECLSELRSKAGD